MRCLTRSSGLIRTGKQQNETSTTVVTQREEALRIKLKTEITVQGSAGHT